MKYSKELFSKALNRKMILLLRHSSESGKNSEIQEDQTQGTQMQGASERFSFLINQLDTDITQLYKNNPCINLSIKKAAVKQLSLLLNTEDLQSRNYQEGFLQAAIKKLIGEFKLNQSKIENTQANPIELFFNLIVKTIEKLVNEALTKETPTKSLPTLDRNISIDSQYIKVKNSSTRQRRMDALARLLDSDRVKSPCIALAVVKNNLIVGVNTPFIKDKTNLEEEMIKISKILVQKITILQSFLQNLENDIKNNQNVNLEQIVNDSYSRLKSLGFSSRFQYTKYKNEERFKMDLRKVTLSFLKSLISKKESGFSTNEQIKKLIKARPIILFPDQSQENTLEGKLHADQIVLIATLRVLSGENISQLTQITAPLALISIDEKNIPEEPIPIGLPKLSCVVCATNFEQFTQYVSYRGSSGIILNRTISSLISKKDISKKDIVEEYRGLYEKINDINTHQNVVYSVHMSKSLVTHIDDSASEDEGIGRILHELTLFKTKKNHTDDSDDATWRAPSAKSRSPRFEA